MATTTTMTAAEYVQARGWDYTAIEATAERGVASEDAEALEDTTVTEDELLTYCLMSVCQGGGHRAADVRGCCGRCGEQLMSSEE